MSRMLEVNGTSLHVVDRGAGLAVLFIHGFPLDHSMWLDQVEALSTERRCIAPDLRGFGRSAPVADRVLTMEAHAADLSRLVRQLDIEAVDVVALSMGGYVALALWEAEPTLFRSLTLIDTRAGADGPEARANRDAMVERLVSDGRSALSVEMVRGLLGSDPPADAVARLRSMTEGSRYETMAAAIRGMRDRPDRSHLLGSISVPTLVLGGAEDRLIPEADVRALGEAIPGSRTVIIRGSGHLPPIEQPEATTAELQGFLAGLDAGPTEGA